MQASRLTLRTSIKTHLTALAMVAFTDSMAIAAIAAPTGQGR